MDYTEPDSFRTLAQVLRGGQAGFGADMLEGVCESETSHWRIGERDACRAWAQGGPTAEVRDPRDAARPGGHHALPCSGFRVRLG
jgi:hypothetical protein